jgi:hypothetical protein
MDIVGEYLVRTGTSSRRDKTFREMENGPELAVAYEGIPKPWIERVEFKRISTPDCE